jgi:hypothetical protein
MYVLNDAMLALSNLNESIGALSGTGGVVLGTGALTTSSASNSTFSGNISSTPITGTNSLVKGGTGTLTLSRYNSYWGFLRSIAGRSGSTEHQALPIRVQTGQSQLHSVLRQIVVMRDEPISGSLPMTVRPTFGSRPH